MKHARRPVATVGALLAVSLLSACGAPKAGLTGGDGPADVTMYALPDSTGAVKKVVDACNTSLNGQTKINLTELTGTDQREQLTRKLSAKDDTIDLMAIPVAWTPEFAATGWAEELRGNNKKSVSDATTAAPLATATYKKKLFAAPWTSDTQVLWYRTDLMGGPPATWNDLLSTANQLKVQNKTHVAELNGVYGSQGVAPLFLSLTSSFGSGFLEKAGGDHIAAGDETKAAASLLHSFATSAAFDADAYSAATDTSRQRFADGNAAFLIASPHAFPAGNRPKNVTIAALPKVDAAKDAKPTLDGTNLVISSYSKHQKQALKALTCLRTGENLQTLATEGNFYAAKSTAATINGERTQISTNPIIAKSISNGTAPLQTPVGGAVDKAIDDVLNPLVSIDVNTVNDKLETSVDQALHFTAKN